jgi:parvulin-like peptidyl-prolyl isomerase
MNKKLIPLLALAFLGLQGLSTAAESVIIAKVGDTEVKAEDIKPLLEKLSPRDQLALSKDPAALNEYVRTLIVQQLLFKEALSKKWEQQPQVVAQLERLRQQAITQSYLQELATPPQDYPSSADIQAAYDLLKKNNALQVPKQYHLAQIYIAASKGSGVGGAGAGTDKEADARAQAKLDAVTKALKSGDFSSVAKAQSQDPASAQRGGDLGWLPETQIQPEIRSAVLTLSKGGTSDPIKTADGWHIIRMVEVKEPYTASLDEVKASITNELRSERAKVLAKAYLAKLLQQNPVTLNEIAVSKLIEVKGN